MFMENTNNSPEQSIQTEDRRFSLLDFIATGFYSGLSPFAPGTAGTLAALILVYLLYCLFPNIISLSTSSLLAVFIIIIGIISANAVCKSKRYGESGDPKQIVIDEFAGYFVSIVGLSPQLSTLLIAFVWFRLFDIIKPPPIRKIEQLTGGYGIVLDDVIAGIYAAIATRGVLYLTG